MCLSEEPEICFTSSVIGTDESNIEAQNGEVSVESGETVVFVCSTGYQGITVVEYLCADGGMFVSNDGRQVECITGNFLFWKIVYVITLISTDILQMLNHY